MHLVPEDCRSPSHSPADPPCSPELSSCCAVTVTSDPADPTQLWRGSDGSASPLKPENPNHGSHAELGRPGRTKLCPEGDTEQSQSRPSEGKHLRAKATQFPLFQGR